MKRRIAGNLLIPVLVLLPLLLTLLEMGWPRDGTWGSVCTVLAGAAGSLALSTFLVAAMLSARVPGWDLWFGGLVRIWTIHRLLGAASFLLVMAHVLLLAMAALPFSVQMSVSALFPPWQDWEIWMGWGAFVAMVCFITPTFGFWGPVHYQRWKRLHLMSAPALVLAMIHTLMVSSQLIWWLLGALAAGAIVWRKLLSPVLARRLYRVQGVDELSRDVVELKLAPEGKGITWAPGQFVYLTPLEPSLAAGYREEHPFTISSTSSDRFMRIGIKGIGDATQALLTLQAGAKVQIEGPYGNFLQEPGVGPRQVWIGGGIGITPFVAGARAWREGEEQQENVALFYLANRPERAYYLDELETVAGERDGFQVYAHYFSESGPLDLDYLADRCKDVMEREVFLCGPPGLIHHVRAILCQAGMPAKRIHTEAFDFL